MSAYPDQMEQQEQGPPGMVEQQEPVEPAHTEVDAREYAEVCLLDAIEVCAKGVKVGVGAENPDVATKWAQAAASLGQAYSYVAGVEQQAANLDQKGAVEAAKLAHEQSKLAVDSRPQPGSGTTPGQNQ